MAHAKNFDDEAPDPYYGLGLGFDLPLEPVEDATGGVVEFFEG